jgi:hypothetical protein
MSYFMNIFYLTQPPLNPLPLIGSIFLLLPLHHLLPTLMNLLFIPLSSLMTLLFSHYLLAPLHLLPYLFLLDILPDKLILLLISMTMFVIVLILLHILFLIMFLIINCLTIILLISSLYIPTLNQNHILRQPNLSVGGKLCKLKFLLLSQLVHGN